MTRRVCHEERELGAIFRHVENDSLCIGYRMLRASLAAVSHKSPGFSDFVVVVGCDVLGGSCRAVRHQGSCDHVRLGRVRRARAERRPGAL